DVYVHGHHGLRAARCAEPVVPRRAADYGHCVVPADRCGRRLLQQPPVPHVGWQQLVQERSHDGCAGPGHADRHFAVPQLVPVVPRLVSSHAFQHHSAAAGAVALRGAAADAAGRVVRFPPQAVLGASSHQPDPPPRAADPHVPAAGAQHAAGWRAAVRCHLHRAVLCAQVHLAGLVLLRIRVCADRGPDPGGDSLRDHHHHGLDGAQCRSAPVVVACLCLRRQLGHLYPGLLDLLLLLTGACGYAWRGRLCADTDLFCAVAANCDCVRA
ncbi:hypothetical protein EC988_008871, partial [Linderina pennispora]